MRRLAASIILAGITGCAGRTTPPPKAPAASSVASPAPSPVASSTTAADSATQGPATTRASQDATQVDTATKTHSATRPDAEPVAAGTDSPDNAAPEVVEDPFPPTRKGRYRVLILGDSMAATDFGVALEKRLDRSSKIRCDRKGKSSSGLARPDFFDWKREAKRQVARTKPDLVVVILGGNDGQDLRPPRKVKGKWIHWGTPQWETGYAERIRELVDLLSGPDRRILWLALPLMDHPRLEKKLATIRRVQEQTLAALEPGARYVPTRQHFLGDDDELLRKVEVKGFRGLRPLRQADGIHFSVPGSRYFARRIEKVVLGALKLTR